jgi:hypothetical protein
MGTLVFPPNQLEFLHCATVDRRVIRRCRAASSICVAMATAGLQPAACAMSRPRPSRCRRLILLPKLQGAICVYIPECQKLSSFPYPPVMTFHAFVREGDRGRPVTHQDHSTRSARPTARSGRSILPSICWHSSLIVS